MENRGGSSERPGADASVHLRLSIDPSRSLTIRRTGRQRCVGSDTEGVTGSNPVAPTTVVAGQGPVSAWPTALRTCRGRAAAAVCSPAEPDGPCGTDDTGPSPAQRPRSVVTTSLSSPIVRHHAGNLPRTHLRGLVSTWVFSCSLPTDQHPGAG